jgi:hypothetical protein
MRSVRFPRCTCASYTEASPHATSSGLSVYSGPFLLRPISGLDVEQIELELVWVLWWHLMTQRPPECIRGAVGIGLASCDESHSACQVSFFVSKSIRLNPLSSSSGWPPRDGQNADIYILDPDSGAAYHNPLLPISCTTYSGSLGEGNSLAPTQTWYWGHALRVGGPSTLNSLCSRRA